MIPSYASLTLIASAREEKAEIFIFRINVNRTSVSDRIAICLIASMYMITDRVDSMPMVLLPFRLFSLFRYNLNESDSKGIVIDRMR